MNPVHREDNYKKYLKYLTGTDEQQAPFNYKLNELVKGNRISEEKELKDFDLMSVSILIWSLLVVIFSYAFNSAVWPLYGFTILLLNIILSRIDNHELYAKAVNYKSSQHTDHDMAIEITRYNLKILRKKHMWLFILFTLATTLTMMCGFHLLNPGLKLLSFISALVISSVIWYVFWLSKSIDASKKLNKFEEELQGILV